jgi:hypothetical protein
VNYAAARRTLAAAAKLADEGGGSPHWKTSIARLSVLCDTASRTHIAFMGTALLAKATDANIDVHSLHVKAGTPGAYSARGLATAVLVPGCQALKVNLGVTGREPLNNQPYFHNDRVSRGMTVKPNSKAALDLVCDLLDELAIVRDESERLSALAAFVEVRRGYDRVAPSYAAPGASLGVAHLIANIEAFVGADSEGGKRAQAVAAGLMDVAEGSQNVRTSRINDPDRNFPGDVAAYAKPQTGADPILALPFEVRDKAIGTSDRQAFESMVTRALEVRDKVVAASDLQAFALKAARFKVARAGVLAVAPSQVPLDLAQAQQAASELGVTLEVFFGWGPYVRQMFFWLPSDVANPVALAHSHIYKRLVELECSEEALERWLESSPGTAATV